MSRLIFNVAAISLLSAPPAIILSTSISLFVNSLSLSLNTSLSARLALSIGVNVGSI